MKLTWVAGVLVGLAAGAGTIVGQELQIGIIDFYGLNTLSEREARQALTFKEGDAVVVNVRPAFLAASEDRLSKLAGVGAVRTNLVCCDAGRVIVYIGIQEEGAPRFDFRPPPAGPARLVPEVLEAGEEFDKVLPAAILRGNSSEDQSQGHALSLDPATRDVQERFITFARRDLSTLREVLRESSNSSQRALAALVIGYAPDKPAVVADLVRAINDPDGDVRNNAMRALFVFTQQTPAAGRPVLQVPYEPFIALLNSPVWSDRNKASMALLALSKSRDAALLSQLRRDALVSLAEMARWKSAGHALAGFVILGRLAGYSDEAAQGAWDRGDRETVIRAALASK